MNRDKDDLLHLEEEAAQSESEASHESFGEYLRRHREASAKTLESISRTTRISKRYLQAFEENQLNQLPEEAFARGFLRSYANEIGLDVEEVLRRYDRYKRSLMPTQVREVRKPKGIVLGGESGEPRGLPERWMVTAVGVGAAAVVLVLIALFVMHRLKESSSSTVPASSTSIRSESPDLAPAAQNKDGQPAAEGDDNKDKPAAPAAQNAPSTPTMATPVRPSILSIAAKRAVKVSVRLDENALQEINLKEGETQVLNVFREIEIRTPDKSAISLQYNGKAFEVSGPIIKIFNKHLHEKR